MFYGKRQMFAPEFIAWLEAFRFPAYQLERKGDQYELTFEGPWIETTMWEIPALAVLMELHCRAVTKGLGKFELQVLYARAMTRVWEKIGRLKLLPDVSIADFGTRRRHGFLWQDWCVQAMIEGLGPALPRHLQLPDRHAARGGGHRHQRARVADGLLRARRERPRAGRGALPGAGRLAAGLRRQPARHAARHLRLAQFPGAGARVGDAPGPASASIPAIPIEGGEIAIAWWQRRRQDPRQKL